MLNKIIKSAMGTLVMLSVNISAMEIVNCDKAEINKEYNYFCVINSDNSFYIKEVVSLNKEPLKAKEKAVGEISFRVDFKTKDELSSQLNRIQRIDNIDDEIFKTKFKMENQNGLIVIINENNNLYTVRSGYVQENGHYLSLKNNTLESLKKEKISNVKKVVAYNEMYALKHNDELWNKKNDQWEKVEIGHVYDFAYLEDGTVYAVTSNGIYSKNSLNGNENFKLMELNIEESLYLDNATFEDYKKDLILELFNEDSRLIVSNNRNFSENNRVSLNNKNNVYINSDIIEVVNNKYRGYDLPSFHYRDTIPSTVIYGFNNSFENTEPNSIYSVDYDTRFPIVLMNEIKTKFNGNVILKEKEKVIIQSVMDDPVSLYENQSYIVNILSNNGVYFSLRSNGSLSVIDTIKNEEHILYNVNNILLENNEIYIVVDKSFESEYTNIENLPLESALKATVKDKFVFKYIDYSGFNEYFKVNNLMPKF